MPNSRRSRLALCLSPLFLGACAADGGSSFVGRLSARITGVGDESAVAGRTAFVQIEGIRVKEKRMVAKEIDPGDAIESKSMVRVDVDQFVGGRSYNYNVIMAPPSGSSAEARGWIKQLIPPAAVSTSGSPAPAYYLDTSGGLIAWGYWPYFSDRWVSAAATGTTIAIETDSASKTSYVYLLPENPLPSPPPGVIITCLDNTSRTFPFDNSTPSTTLFVEITNCGTTMTWPPTVNSVLPGTPREDFVKRMKDAKTAAPW